MKTWIKLYTEINRDPDMGTLTWAERGIWSALLALAGEIDDQDDDGPTGFIGTTSQVAWHLRCDQAELRSALDSFIKRGMVDVDIDLQVTLINFGKRQRRAPSSQPERVAERVQRHRARQQAGCNEDVTTLKQGVTPSDTDSDTDTDSEETQKRVDVEVEKSKTPPPQPAESNPDNESIVGEVFTAWHGAVGLMTATQAEIVGDMVDTYGAENVKAAIIEAAKSSTRITPNYVDAILKRWASGGTRERAAPAGPAYALAEDGSIVMGSGGGNYGR